MKRATLLVLAILIAACGRPDAGITPAPQRVTLTAARSGAGLPAIRVTGTLSPKDQVPMSFKVGGVIARFNVDEGSRVTGGQVLAELQRTEVDSGVRQASELAAKAERDLARAESLFADKVITREQAEDARTQAEVARAALATARFNAGYAVIRAPGPGIVLHRLAEAGQLVQAGAPVLELANEARGWVMRASVADRDVVNLRLGDAAQARLDAFPGKVFSGRITQITRAADPRTGTFDLEVGIDSADLTTPVAGLLAKLDISPGAPAPALVHVPIECLIEGDHLRAWVFVYDSATRRVHRRAVDVAFIDAGGDVALRSGVSPGETLVNAGIAYLRDGDQVEVHAS
jgi:RND family efflux transporter MFP subunit